MMLNTPPFRRCFDSGGVLISSTLASGGCLQSTTTRHFHRFGDLPPPPLAHPSPPLTAGHRVGGPSSPFRGSLCRHGFGGCLGRVNRGFAPLLEGHLMLSLPQKDSPSKWETAVVPLEGLLRLPQVPKSVAPGPPPGGLERGLPTMVSTLALGTVRALGGENRKGRDE